MEQEQLFQSLHLDTTTRPPSPPVGCGTRLYPEEPGLVNLTDAAQLTNLMAAASRARKNSELSLLYSAKSFFSDSIALQYGGQSRYRPYCDICSEIKLVNHSNREMHIKYRTHISSLQSESTWSSMPKVNISTQPAKSHHTPKRLAIEPPSCSLQALACWRGRLKCHFYPGDRLHVD